MMQKKVHFNDKPTVYNLAWWIFYDKLFSKYILPIVGKFLKIIWQQILKKIVTR